MPLVALGITIRWVERVVWPGRAGFRPPVRGIGIGWVVAVPPGGEEGINPLGCGGLTVGKAAEVGGF